MFKKYILYIFLLSAAYIHTMERTRAEDVRMQEPHFLQAAKIIVQSVVNIQDGTVGTICAFPDQSRIVVAALDGTTVYDVAFPNPNQLALYQYSVLDQARKQGLIKADNPNRRCLPDEQQKVLTIEKSGGLGVRKKSD